MEHTSSEKFNNIKNAKYVFSGFFCITVGNDFNRLDSKGNTYENRNKQYISPILN